MSNTIKSPDFNQFPLREYASFEELRVRLLPEIDLEKVFGSYWDTHIEGLFSKADRHMWEAEPDEPTVPQWYVIQFGPAASKLNRETHMHSARSLAEAIAALAEDCCNNGVWPDTVDTLDQPYNGVELCVENTLLARIIPVASTPRHSLEQRKRAQGTLKGLRKKGSANSELVARLRRWPGMHNLGLHDDEVSSTDAAWHLPEPGEWLLSAKLLCTAAGWSDPSMLDLQTVVCKVFAQKSWNHLCALYDAHKGRSHPSNGALWSVCAIQDVDDWAEGSSWCYFDAYDAMSHWATLGADFLKVHPKVELSVMCASGGVRRGLAILDLVVATDSTSPLASFYQPKVSMEPCASAEVSPVWLTRAKAAIANNLRDGLLDLFQVNRGIEQRHHFRVAELDGKLLLREGAWYFYTDGGEGESKHLHACLMGPQGNLVGSAGVPLYKGNITWDAETGGYVMTRDYDLKSPVAIVKGISTAAADRLQQYLKRSHLNFYPIDRDDDRYKRLLKYMTPNGAIRPF